MTLLRRVALKPRFLSDRDYKNLPCFRLVCNWQATFWRLMNVVLDGLNWEHTLVYLDDVIVSGKSFEEHINHLESLMQRLEGVGLKVNAKKYRLFCQE